MKVVIAPDSFKEALSSQKVAEAIAEGFHLADPSVETCIFPLGDGGEGTSEVLGFHLHADKEEVFVEDALGRNVPAFYFYAKKSKTAIIEMAEAAGLHRIAPEERKVTEASSFGVGQLISYAIQKGAERVILAIGGSATTDAGMGMLSALGIRFYDDQNNLLKGTGADLSRIHHFDNRQSIIPDYLKVDVICDVANPLYGTEGAAYVYARQKGANEKEIKLMDEGLRHFAKVLNLEDIALIPGAGAAGGMGAGCMALMDAQLHRGIDLMLETTGFDEHIRDAGLIITGEGKMDRQTVFGKLIHGVSEHARKYSVPVVALCGSLDIEPEEMKRMYLKAVFSIQSKPVSLEDALKNTYQDLVNFSFNLMNLLELKPIKK